MRDEVASFFPKLSNQMISELSILFPGLPKFLISCDEKKINNLPDWQMPIKISKEEDKKFDCEKGKEDFTFDNELIELCTTPKLNWIVIDQINKQEYEDDDSNYFSSSLSITKK